MGCVAAGASLASVLDRVEIGQRVWMEVVRAQHRVPLDKRDDVPAPVGVVSLVPRAERMASRATCGNDRHGLGVKAPSIRLLAARAEYQGSTRSSLNRTV
jgi:hypothetical protein